MSEAIYLLGAGDHGCVALDALLACGAPMAGILDPGLPAASRLLGVQVLGDDAALDEMDPATMLLANGIGANPRTAARRRLFLAMRERGFRWATVRHPAAVVARGVTLGEGCHLMAAAVVQYGARLGDNVLINTGAIVEHDAVVEAHAVVSPGAVVCGDAEVGEAAFIGAGALLLPAVRVGAHAIVGAGSVVIEDVAAGATMVGNPARPLVATLIEERR